MGKKFGSAGLASYERQMIEKAGKLVEKWAAVIDSDKAPPVNDVVERAQLAQMLETANTVLTAEATQTTSVYGSNYVAAMLGITRQVFPRLIGKNVAAIQPLDKPEGRIFHLKMLRDDSTDVASYGDWSNYNSYGDFSLGEGVEITTGMKLSITSEAVSVGTPKKLRVGASLELMQDLRAYHNLDAMDLLQGASVDEIAREIDGLLVAAARAAAIAHKTVTFGITAPGTGGWTAETWRKRLQRAILLADNEVYKDEGRETTFIIAGANAALELQDLNNFSADLPRDSEDGSYGLQPIGTLNSRWLVMRSRYVPTNELLLGRKGAGFLDAGIVYAPYVPLFISDRVFDVTNQRWDQSFMSRFLIKTVSNGLFARVVIDENGTGIS